MVNSDRRDALEHPRIDDEHLVDRYLAGRLPAEVEALFEEHLFACEACLAAVEAGEHLRQGLREVAAEDAIAPTVDRVVRRGRGRSSTNLRPWLALAASLAVLVSLAIVWRAADVDQGALPASLEGPVGGVPVIALGPVRDATRPTPIPIESTADVLLLSLELPAVTASTYRVTLVDAAGTEMWRGEGLEPNLYDALAVVVPTDFFQPGTYRAIVDAEPAGHGGAVEMAFRILDESG